MRFKVRGSESGLFNKPSSTSRIFYWKPELNSRLNEKKHTSSTQLDADISKTHSAYKYGNL
jgi:hypothetical protein